MEDARFWPNHLSIIPAKTGQERDKHRSPRVKVKFENLRGARVRIWSRRKSVSAPELERQDTSHRSSGGRGTRNWRVVAAEEREVARQERVVLGAQPDTGSQTPPPHSYTIHSHSNPGRDSTKFKTLTTIASAQFSSVQSLSRV